MHDDLCSYLLTLPDKILQILNSVFLKVTCCESSTERIIQLSFVSNIDLCFSVLATQRIIETFEPAFEGTKDKCISCGFLVFISK